jgi:hypothetical protein
MNSSVIGMEALGLAASEYSFLHKYTDNPSYTRVSPIESASPIELLGKIATDKRFDGLFKTPSFNNFEPVFKEHETLLLEYWNAWAVADEPIQQFQQSQEAAVALLVATVSPGTHLYNFFLVHVLTTSHAVRVILPYIPVQFHISLLRQWWLLSLAIYVAMLRPRIDFSILSRDLDGKGWSYVEDKAINSPWAVDAHFVKGELLLLFLCLEVITKTSHRSDSSDEGVG